MHRPPLIAPNAMQVPRRAVRAVALAILVLAGAVQASNLSAPRFALSAAQIEAAPPALEQARFRVRASLQPITPARVKAADGALRMSAVLTHQTTTALCSVPGDVFRDGFEPF